MAIYSFVIPVYRSENTLLSVVDEIRSVMLKRQSIEYEIILVSDASPDNVYELIKKLASEDGRIKGIRFAKNFGQHAAIMAGFRASKGDIVFTVDDDGQVPVDELFKLADKIDEGYDAVFAKYDRKKHSIFRNLGSSINLKMMEALIGKPKNLSVNSYMALKKFLVDEIVRYNNPYPYLAGLIFRSSINACDVLVHHRKRQSGTSGYTIKKLVSLLLNGFTAFSVKPLRLAIYLGSIISVIGFVYGIYTVISKLRNFAMPLGYASLMSAILFIGGMILMLIGMVGEYVGRIYICINQSPQYVIAESVNIIEDK